MRVIGPRVVLRQWTTRTWGFQRDECRRSRDGILPEEAFTGGIAGVFHRLKNGIEERGWGLWGVEINGQLAGFTGLARPAFEAHFTPRTEIGWRFRPQFWGQGYATEAARLALLYAFSTLQLEEVVSFTASGNFRSVNVMRRLGMKHDPKDDFDIRSLQTVIHCNITCSTD